MAINFDTSQGQTISSWTSGTRPASPNPGQFGLNTSLTPPKIEFYNGNTWMVLTTTS